MSGSVFRSPSPPVFQMRVTSSWFSVLSWLKSGSNLVSWCIWVHGDVMVSLCNGHMVKPYDETPYKCNKPI